MTRILTEEPYVVILATRKQEFMFQKRFLGIP